MKITQEILYKKLGCIYLFDNICPCSQGDSRRLAGYQVEVCNVLHLDMGPSQ